MDAYHGHIERMKEVEEVRQGYDTAHDAVHDAMILRIVHQIPALLHIAAYLSTIPRVIAHAAIV